MQTTREIPFDFCNGGHSVQESSPSRLRLWTLFEPDCLATKSSTLTWCSGPGLIRRIPPLAALLGALKQALSDSRPTEVTPVTRIYPMHRVSSLGLCKQFPSISHLYLSSISVYPQYILIFFDNTPSRLRNMDLNIPIRMIRPLHRRIPWVNTKIQNPPRRLRKGIATIPNPALFTVTP
ncbi:hypothetical protein BJY04DRAFT_13352 [Aspergillus karnatakaensis]|uniref:uncharacterized protein n=1 Tax=Aspergillus karnatakaensis TaxID=1810916 RepID=UPI003CCE51D9